MGIFKMYDVVIQLLPLIVIQVNVQDARGGGGDGGGVPHRKKRFCGNNKTAGRTACVKSQEVDMYKRWREINLYKTLSKRLM